LSRLTLGETMPRAGGSNDLTGEAGTARATWSGGHLRDGLDPSRLGPDVTDCDREPIHIPGAIQPHGLLLVADADLVVVGGAGDVEGRLAADWIGRPLPELLGRPLPELASAGAPAEGPAEAVALGPVVTGQPSDEGLDASARFQDGRWLVQLEPRSTSWADAATLLAWLDGAGGLLERAADLKELCARAAEVFRELTGFDRVMIYRFLDDGAGVVVAEDRDPELGSFLNHHFPASDVPKQARDLYVRNRVRVIPDAGYAPAPLRPAGLRDLDLSDIDLRSVSPIHVQYLRNMGVGASASVSIVKDGLLWGLVACHHRAPRTLPYAERLACRALGGSLARQVRAKEEAEGYRERLRLRAAEDVVAGRLMAEADLGSLIAESADDLQRMLAADGFAAVQGRELTCVGRCPDRADVREVAAWVRGGGAVPIHTESLPEIFPEARAYADLASGLLAVTVSSEEPIILLWFRAEHRELVEWAGNPHKAVTVRPGETLSPRASFEAWTEEVRGRARPWTLNEIDAAGRLVRALFEARQTRRIRELNKELSATVADKESLLVQKDYLLKEVNHRVQNSLQIVSAFLAMQARAEKDPTLTKHLEEAQRRLSAVALVHRRLYSDDSVQIVDLARYLEELIQDMRTALGEDWASALAVDLAPVAMPVDAAVNVGLVLTELVINANKYAYDGQPGPLSISLEQYRNRFRLIVADRGHGKAGTRQGFGTRMLTAMVDRLGGTIEETGNKPGLRVIVTAPIGAVERPVPGRG
jgi:two-component system, chemotaxis family, sensor kinase Cph1